MKQMRSKFKFINRDTSYFITSFHKQGLSLAWSEKRTAKWNRLMGRGYRRLDFVNACTPYIPSTNTFSLINKKSIFTQSKARAYVNSWSSQPQRKKSYWGESLLPLSALVILSSFSDTVSADEIPREKQIVYIALSLIDKGQLEAALALLRKEAQSTPSMKEIAYTVLEESFGNSANVDIQGLHLFLKGLFAYSLDYPNEGLEILKKAITLHSKFDEMIYYAIIEMLYELGCRTNDKAFFYEQLGYYKKLLESNPTNPNNKRAFNDMAQTLSLLELYKEAIDSCDEAIKIDPKFKEAYITKGHVFLEQKKFTSALAAFDQAIIVSPQDVHALHEKAITLAVGFREYEKALRCLDQLFKINPRYPKAYYNYAIILCDLNRQEEAIAYYDKAISCDLSFEFAYYNKAYLLNELGKYKDAKSTYKKVIEINKANVAAHVNLGNTYVKLWEKEKSLSSDNNQEQTRKLAKYSRKAHECFETALAAQADMKQALYSKALLFKKQDEFKKATDLFKYIIEKIDPTDKWSHYNLADILLKQGEQDTVLEKYVDGMVAVEKAYAKEHKQKILHAFYAVELGNLENARPHIQDIYINSQNNTGDTLLIVAARKGHTSIVDYLLQCDADVDIGNKAGKTAITIAKESRHNNIAERISKIQRQRAMTSASQCFTAIEKGDIDTVKRLTKTLDVNTVNSKGESLLITAVKHKQLPIVTYLITQNAKIHLGNPHNDFKTPIEYAVDYEYWDILELLLKERKALTESDLKSLIDTHVSDYKGTIYSENIDIAWLNDQINRLVHAQVGNMRTAEFAMKGYKKDNAKYLGMLHKLNAEMQLDGEKIIASSGWRPELFLPLRIRCLFALVIEIQRGNFNHDLPVSPEIAKNKLIAELLTDIECLRARRDGLAIQKATQKIQSNKLDSLITAHAENIYAKLVQLQDREEYSYDSGYAGSITTKTEWLIFKKEIKKMGHCVYVNFTRESENIVIRVDNLGDSIDKFHEKEPGINKWKPHIVGVIPIIHFHKQKVKVINYLKACIRAKLEPENLKVIYTDTFQEFKPSATDRWLAKMSQFDNSCVTRSHDVGMDNRLGHPLYRWTKKYERSMVFTRVPDVKRDIPPQTEQFDMSGQKINRALPS